MRELEKVFNRKINENGDVSYSTTGDNLVDLLFMTEYYSKNLNEVSIGTSDKEKLFSMFIRDPRKGLGKRDLGRKLMKESEVSIEDIVFAGRYDDVFEVMGINPESVDFIWNEVNKGNALAKKWMPRLTSKNRDKALQICKIMNISQKYYRKTIKEESTIEYKLSHKEFENINFEHIPSLAMLKYAECFRNKEELEEKYYQYINRVKDGTAKINTSVTNVYDLYLASKKDNGLPIDKMFEQMKGKSLNMIPIVDTSGSMTWKNDAFGKALAVGHYIAKVSSYAPDLAISFSSYPQLLNINGLNYTEAIEKMYTGDCSNTDLGKVLDLIKDLKEDLPDYFVVLSDMEFDEGSNKSLDRLMSDWKERDIKTRIIWWNFNGRNKTIPEADEYGNIFFSGYSPQLLGFLQSGVDGKEFLDNLLSEYAKYIENNK